MQGEEEEYKRIIKDSQQKLLTLGLLSNFFNHKNLVAALIKTRVIHNLFLNNRQLDINKLDLFHVQYTSSLIDLFQKLKKKKEQQYLLTEDEMQINEDSIGKLTEDLGDSSFPEQMKAHAGVMSQKIGQLYNLLVTEKNGPFTWAEINQVSGAVQSEFYREIDSGVYDQLSLTNKPVYQNSFATVEKKLLGRLNIHQFRIKFLCGLVNAGRIVEVYEFRDSNDRFVFITANRAFYFLDELLAKQIDLSKNTSSKEEVINQLKARNIFLKEQLGLIKVILPENVQQVLVSYVDKIAAVDFVTDLQNVDEQTNILKTMLNININ